MAREWESLAAQQTESLGQGLAALLGSGDLVFLRGELGTGKTTLVRAIARGLGVAGAVTSPTFTVVQRYRGRIDMAHMDAYRIGRADDEEAELLVDALGHGALALVEWPDAIADLLPEPRLAISIEHLGGPRRLVRLRAADAVLCAALEDLCDHLRARYRHGRPERRADAGD